MRPGRAVLMNVQSNAITRAHGLYRADDGRSGYDAAAIAAATDQCWIWRNVSSDRREGNASASASAMTSTARRCATRLCRAGGGNADEAGARRLAHRSATR